LTGCSLLPGQDPDVTPSDQAGPVATASASAARSPAPSATAEPTVPTFTASAFPSIVVPSSDTTEKGLRVSQTTIRGRSSSASWAIAIPVFSGAPVAKGVNRRVRAAANDLIAQVRREAKDDAGVKRTLTGEGAVVTNDGRTVQVTIIFIDSLAGTAHPANAVTTTVVDVGRARPVLLGQVIQNPPEGLRLLKAEVIKAAKKKGEPVDPAGLAPKLTNWANWQTTPDGMTFYFDDYQLGGYGLRRYTVPWRSARLALSEYGETLLAPR
jgi:hypothetical protein